jgi:hypothetical protein
MNPAVERLLWRLDAYDQVGGACAQSSVEPLRFLTFRPEKMRIRIGESLMKSQVPVVFAADLADRMAALLPPAQPAPASGPLGLDRDGLRAAISVAQLDGDLDPIDVQAWSGERRDAFLEAFNGLYDRFLEEARSAGSGEETAALFQLVAMSSLRNVLLHSVGANDRFFGQAALLAHLCDRALASSVERQGDGLSGRLGLLMIASCSPISLMGAAPSVAARPVNAYRTIPTAFTAARDMVRATMDRATGFDVPAMRARLSAELLGDAKRRRDLVRSSLAEAVRDLSLLSTLTQGSELRDLASSSSALSEALFEPLGPEKLRARIDRHPRGTEEPLSRLSVLVDSVGAILAGDTAPLRQMGSIEERADIAAAGALLLAFDELTLEQGGHALGMVRTLPPEEAEQARAQGRAYYFSLDDEPLFEIPAQRNEAFLFADMKDFTKRTVDLREDNMGDFLKRQFYEPILRTCAHFARNPQTRVSVVNLLGDAVACRGDVQSMVALALYIRQLLDEAANELALAQRSVSGGAGVIREIDMEISRIEGLVSGLGPGDPRRAGFDQQLVELRAGRDERLNKAAGGGLEAGVFVTWGREAHVIEVGGPEVGEWRVVIAEQLNAAARGTNRVPAVVAERDELRARDEAAQGRQLADPFQVHTSKDPHDVSPTTVFHNAGSAVSGDALAAYEAANPTLGFQRMSVPRASLPPRLHKYWLPRETEELVLCTDGSGVPALLFRFTGRTIFRGLEAHGGSEVWEILLVDRGFGSDFVTALSEV